MINTTGIRIGTRVVLVVVVPVPWLENGVAVKSDGSGEQHTRGKKGSPVMQY